MFQQLSCVKSRDSWRSSTDSDLVGIYTSSGVPCANRSVLKRTENAVWNSSKYSYCTSLWSKPVKECEETHKTRQAIHLTLHKEWGQTNGSRSSVKCLCLRALETHDERFPCQEERARSRSKPPSHVQAIGADSRDALPEEKNACNVTIVCGQSEDFKLLLVIEQRYNPHRLHTGQWSAV